MAYLHDERDEDDIEHPKRARERELTLSTGTILAVFFGLALSWGAFFAFGYNMGSKTRTISTAAATMGEGTPGAETNFSNFKPSSGTPAIEPVPGYLSAKEAATANKNAASVSAYPAPASSDAGPVKPPPSPRNPPVTGPDAGPPPTAVRNAPPPVVRAPLPVSEPSSGPVPSGSFMVQIAAVTHQEDADLEMSSLRRRGYAVVSRTEPADRFIHIQVGPFSNKKDAEAMRQRLITDGYNAILK